MPDSAGNEAVFTTELGSGNRREVWRGVGHAAVAGWGSDGIYFTRQRSVQQGQADTVDLWAIDPGKPGQARRVDPRWVPALPGSPDRPLFSSETKLSGGAAWDITRWGSSNSDHVERMDLQTGTASIWYTAPPEHVVYILGFDDSGHPVLALYPRDASSTKACCS